MIFTYAHPPYLYFISLKDFVFLQLQPYRIPMPITLTCQLQIASVGDTVTPPAEAKKGEKDEEGLKTTPIFGVSEPSS